MKPYASVAHAYRGRPYSANLSSSGAGSAGPRGWLPGGRGRGCGGVLGALAQLLASGRPPRLFASDPHTRSPRSRQAGNPEAKRSRTAAGWRYTSSLTQQHLDPRFSESAALAQIRNPQEALASLRFLNPP